MAVERVEQRLRKVTAALNDADVPYAVIGGNAVAAWVAKADPSATRTTVDVDLLVKQQDVGRVTDVFQGLGFTRHNLRPMLLFTDPEEPSKRSGVHLVWAGQKMRPSYSHAAPLVDESVFDPQGFWVIDLPALVKMKLTSLRDIDRVHIGDLLSVGLIDEGIRASLPDDLRARLVSVEASREREA